MQNLRDKLIKAGLVSAEQTSRADARGERNERKPAEKAAREAGAGAEGGAGAGARPGSTASAGAAPAVGSKNGTPAAAGSAAKSSGAKRRRSRKPAASRGLIGPRGGVDVPDPRTLDILRAIEQHRVRGDTRGDAEFHFELRDGRIRKMFVTRELAHGLSTGRFAIVECGDPERHIVVERDAVTKIRAADALAVRFFNDEAIASA